MCSSEVLAVRPGDRSPFPRPMTASVAKEQRTLGTPISRTPRDELSTWQLLSSILGRRGRAERGESRLAGSFKLKRSFLVLSARTPWVEKALRPAV